MPIRHDRGAPDRDADGLDSSLVRALQADGRASIHELARTLGVSRDLVSRRLSTLIGRDGRPEVLPLLSKVLVADAILDRVEALLHAR